MKSLILSGNPISFVELRVKIDLYGGRATTVTILKGLLNGAMKFSCLLDFLDVLENLLLLHHTLTNL